MRSEPKPARPRSKGPKRAKQTRRNVLELITVGVTSPALAEGTKAAQRHAAHAQRSTRPTPLALSKLPWLRQDRSYRVGNFLMTHGLQKHAGHLEIEVCNVPGALVPAVQAMLNRLADMILIEADRREGRAKIEPKGQSCEAAFGET